MGENIGRLFLRETSLQKMLEQTSDQGKGLPIPPISPTPDPEKWRIPLASPKTLSFPPLDIRDSIEKRRSHRSYSDNPLSIEELSWLLWATQGIQRTSGEGNTLKVYSTVPSAGGRHPLDVWLVLSRVAGVSPGLYSYLPEEHAIQEEDVSRDFAEDIAEVCGKQFFISKGAVSFFWMGDEYRFMWKHMERGYRFVFLDAGHACQNLYLACEAIGCGCCAIGNFDEDALRRLFRIGKEGVFPVYGATVGKK